MAGYICKICESEMYARKSKMSFGSTQVHICPQCDTILYVWPDGDEKWEEGNIVSVARHRRAEAGKTQSRPQLG